MIQIAICDDQIDELEITYSMAETYYSLHPELNISFRKFRSAYDLLESISSRKHFDIYLLDILMPNANGIEVGTAIRESDSAAVIIYLTSSPDYALQSYQVDAGGYLLKPLTEDNLFAILDKVIARLDAEDQKRLILRTSNDGIESIPYSHLLYLEYYQHRIIAHTTDHKSIQSIYYRESFKELTASLTDNRFVKIAASMIVNMQHIRNINSREIRLSNEEKLNISRLFATEARRTFMAYLLDMGD